MSIPHMFKKIKHSLGLDQATGIYVLVVIGVAISAFGLGRLSVENGQNRAEQGIAINDVSMGSTGPKKGGLSTNLDQFGGLRPTSVGNYVASKNGKLYYTPDCSGAKRIKTENQVWFSTRDEAEKLGYTFSTSCK